MARRLAAAEEVLNLVPTKADAEFMRQHATEMVGLKTASMRLAVNPESAPPARPIRPESGPLRTNGLVFA